MVDASAAVSAAASWTPVSEEVPIYTGVLDVGREIPDGDGNGVTDAITIEKDITVEWVEVVFDADHELRSDLEIELTSPSGTTSVLAFPWFEFPESDAGYNNWMLTSVRHWGESSLGEWQLQVVDKRSFLSDEAGTWNSWELNFYGTKPTVPSQVFVDDDWSSLAFGTSVDPDGNGTAFAPGDGTIGIDAFSSINEGIQKVKTDSANPGTVRVFAGTYGEIVGITKPVSLIGPNASINPNTQTRVDEARIAGTSAGIGFLPGANAGQVIIDGFWLGGPGTGPGAGATIDTRNAGANTTIRNNVIRNVDNDAIRNFPKSNPLFNDTSNLVIENNLIDPVSGNGSRRGMFLQDVKGLTIAGNVVQNITSGDNPGILIDTVTGNVLLENNTLTNIASQGIQVAGIGAAGGTVSITGNVLTNVNAGPDGISGSGDEDITNAGIRLRNSPWGEPLSNGTVSITNNRIENTLNGLLIRNPADATVVTVSDNYFINTVANPGGSSGSLSFEDLSAGTYDIINGGVNSLNAEGNFKDLPGTNPLDSVDVAGSVVI